MNVFEKLAQEEKDKYLRLGNPLGPDLQRARMTFMQMITGGKGFRQLPKMSNGKRREAKAKARAIMLEKIAREREAAAKRAAEFKRIFNS